MKYGLIFVLSFLFLFGIQSCSPSKENINTDNIKVNTQYFPFYLDFSNLDTSNLPKDLQQLKVKYPDFLDFYLDTLVGLNIHKDYTSPLPDLKSFLTYKDYRGLFDTVNLNFPNTSSLNKELDQLFKRIKYYDSSFYQPKNIFYFVSGLNRFIAVIQNDQNLGIGLDMFLGPKYSGYHAIQIPDYALEKLKKSAIPVWVGQAIYQDKYPFVEEGKTLLEMMVEKGKEQYFLEKVLPDLADSIKFGYTSEQMQWAAANEAFIYNFFLQNNLLYEKNQQKIMRYVMEGPNTPGFPENSPGNLGTFIGWKIVQSYVKNARQPLKEVLQTTDAQRILNLANYKP